MEIGMIMEERVPEGWKTDWKAPEKPVDFIKALVDAATSAKTISASIE